MITLSNRIQNLSESQTIAMSRQSRELQEKGIDIINLSLGEPDFNTPDFIKEGAKLAIDQNFSKYPPVPGYADLRKAIVDKLKRENQLDYSLDQIVVSTGAKQSIANLILCLVNPGDEVLLPAPFWVSYAEIVKLAEGIPVYLSAGIEKDFKVSAQAIREATSDKTKLLLFSSPCNPTGSVYTKEELHEFANVLKENPSVFCISDEIYEYIIFDGEHHSIAQFNEVKEQVAVVNGVSKGYAMTGWRIGYTAAPLWLAKACTKMQGQFTSGASTIAQKAAKTAIETGGERVREMCKAFNGRRDKIKTWLDAIDGFKTNLPHGAFYIFPNISAFFGKKFNGEVIENANDFSMFLLNEAHVSTVTGEAFGAPDCIRISYAASEKELEEACNRIRKAVQKLS